jgi:RNA polymerase sigma-70 factor (ECF subfamily)
MDTRDDNYYVEKVLQGEIVAFTTLVNRHKDLVFTIAMNITRNREDAEEVAQDVFLNAFRKLDGFRKEASLATWLYRIAYNESISKVRKKKIITMDLEEDVMDIIPDEDLQEDFAGLDEIQRKQVVTKILDKLPEIDRVLVTLFYLENLPVAEITGVTGLGESNVKVRLHRVRKKIYQDLKGILKIRSLHI